MSDHDDMLEKYRDRYTRYVKRLLKGAVEQTGFESFFIGCNASCNSLLGPVLWRKWDKPYLEEIVREVHRYGRLIHNHNHGKIMETVPDIVEIGFDCVCPFEREPGDVVGLEGLKKVRRLLNDRVTFNGNVATVKTLIGGTPRGRQKRGWGDKGSLCGDSQADYRFRRSDRRGNAGGKPVGDG